MIEFLLIVIVALCIIILFNVVTEEKGLESHVVFEPKHEMRVTDFERTLLRAFIYSLPITDERLTKEFDFIKLEYAGNEFPKFRYKDTRLVIMNDRGNYIPLWEDAEGTFSTIGKQIRNCEELHKLIESLT